MSEKSSQITNNRVPSDWDHFAQYIHMPKEEPRQDAFLDLQQQFNKQMKKQEQQMHSMISQMTKEFRDQVGLLCDHITKTAELQESSLKHDIRQEFDALNQELKKTIKEHYKGCENEELSSNAGHEVIRMHRNIRGSNSFKRDIEDHIQISRQDKQHMDNLSDSAHDLSMAGSEESTLIASGMDKDYGNRDKLKQESGRVPSKSRENNGNTSIHDEQTRRLYSNVSQNNSGAQFDIQLSSAISQTSLNESIAATGFYADAVSNQMKQTLPQDIIRSKAANASASFSTAISYQHNQQVIFPGIKKLKDSGKYYSSPFIETILWKARLCVGFSPSQNLKVQVCISGGEYGDELRSLQFSGYGELFNQKSKRFTAIWQLAQVTSQKPTSTELQFSAEVCLLTSRGSYPKITYKDLEYRGYTENDEFTFRWFIKAEKCVNN